MAARRKFTPNSTSSTNSARGLGKRPEKLAAAKRIRQKKATADRRQKTIRKALNRSTQQLALDNRRHLVVLDACNISFVQCYLPRFSVSRLQQAIEYFQSMGLPVVCLFPRFHLYTGQWDDRQHLHRLYKSNCIVATPCKESPCPRSQVYEDRIIAEIAHRFNGFVITNDRFRDIAAENEDWRRVAETRRIPFDWINDETFSIPNYGRRSLEGD